MSFDTQFGSIWLPDLSNLLYIRDANGLVMGMQFCDKYDAIAAYDEYVVEWTKSMSISLTFVVAKTSYDVICYQDPKRSHSKRNLCLYKDSLSTQGGLFLKSKKEIQDLGCRVAIYYNEDSKYKRMGLPLDTDTKIILESDIIAGSYEDVIRHL